MDIKIALCYYGYAFNMGNTKNTTANDTAVNYNATYSNHKNKLIDPNCLTVTGKTVGENLENIDIPKNQDVVSFPNNPISKEGGIAIFNGTLSPN